MYEKLVEYVKVESKELNDNVVFSYGDLLTCKSFASLKDMWIREAKAGRLEFATPKAADPVFYHN
jgi:hypothetical protein